MGDYYPTGMNSLADIEANWGGGRIYCVYAREQELNFCRPIELRVSLVVINIQQV